MTTVERTPVIPVGTLYPCCACLCCMNSLVCRSFDCVGIYSRDACCCIQVDNYCCKYTNEPGYDCILYRSECMKGDCRACCQVSQKFGVEWPFFFLLFWRVLSLLFPLQTEKQFCCFDFRCQDRKTDEQPCICTMFFFTVSYFSTAEHFLGGVIIISPSILLFLHSVTIKTNEYAPASRILNPWNP